ncbi:MAG: hypothetical protein COA61_009725 [Zetaproteobacteria bacterium]|nr:hypothetical protein [Zetaproteobacteria bacterium]
MSWFSGLGDIAADMVCDISVTVGGNTYDNVFTTIGETIGGSAELVGKVADVLTDDVNIDLDDAW